MRLRRKTMLVPVAGATLGLVLIAALVTEVGVRPLEQALSAVGWPGFSAICLIRCGVIVGMGLAWRAVVPATPAWVLVWGRLVRDAGSEILPFSQIGGLALGARAVALAGVPALVGAASTIVDVTLEFLSKIAYLGLGLLWLVRLHPLSPAMLPLAIGLAATGLTAVAVCVVQRHGSGVVDRLARGFAHRWAGHLSAGAAAVHSALAESYRRKLGVCAGFVLHLGCWIASALEVWAALRLANMPLDFGVVLVIESLLYGIRTFAFAIPNAIGVQEASYVFIGASFGLTPEIALAISFLKRARDLAIGLPTLGLWQAVEGKRLLPRKRQFGS